MRVRVLPCWLVLLLFVVPRHGCAQVMTAEFSTGAPTAVPGLTLPNGSFSIAVVGFAGGRYIMRLEDKIHDPLATFLGVPNDTLAQASSTGRIDWPKSVKGVTSLKGWYFPAAHTGIEFVYPKAEAVALAQANQAQVIAIDPASDGLAASTPLGLSPRQLHTVTLWALTLTHAGPSGTPAGIAASRYTQVASAAHKPAVPRLPHTASNLPWICLLGSLSLVGATGFRVRRLAVARRG